MVKQNEANGTASESIARYDELPILRTYKVAFDNIVEIGGFWAVGQDKNLYRIEMPGKVKDGMWKNAKRYDIQTGKVVGYTNADLIHSMTDEELADFIARQRFSAVNPIADKLDVDITPAFMVGRKNALDWLRQEATNDGDD